jgi:hypothetical protein
MKPGEIAGIQVISRVNCPINGNPGYFRRFRGAPGRSNIHLNAILARFTRETASSFEELVESIIESAQVETTMKRLLDEIESTKRRVNALEFKVIPELTSARDFIKMRLDEMEREELFRLKKIKARTGV